MLKMLMMMCMLLILSNKSPMMVLIMMVLVSSIFSLVLLLITLNYWTTFLLIFMFVSGMMVLFMYMISLSPNEKTLAKNSTKVILAITTLLYIFIFVSKMSATMKMNMLYNTNTFISMMMTMVVGLCAIIPAKMILYSFSGMKTSK